jgi:hypothetical protein
MYGARAWTLGIGLIVPLALAALAACGSRTGLLFDEGVDSFGDGGVTVLPDGRVVPVDAGHDAPPDALPLIDARPLPDVQPSNLCADASATLVYVVTESNRVLRFDPTAGSFGYIGTLNCPDSRQPFSMAVDRQGIAYVLYAVYNDTTPGSIYRVSLRNARCTPTAFTPGTSGFNSFGMGFSADVSDPGETLYVASDDTGGGELGAIDPLTLSLSPVGFFNPAIVGAELSGTGDGRLFAFYSTDQTARTSSVIAQIDKTSGNVLAEDPLPTIAQGDAWAFAFWGGDFYLFTAPEVGGNPATSSILTRYRPSDGSLRQVATYGELIVGAGVSTCAPQQ